MAKTHEPGGEPLVPALLICAALFALLGWGMLSIDHRGSQTHEPTASPTTPYMTRGLEWPELVIRPEALARARAEHARAVSDHLDHPAAERLRALVRELNDYQFETTPIPAKAPQKRERLLSVAVSDAITAAPATHFVDLGGPVFEACERSFARLQEAIARGDLTLQEAIADPDFERFEAYRQNCGQMLGELHRRGLVDDQGAWTDASARALARTLQRYRWAHMAHLYAPPLEQLPELERTTLLRWRVETQDAFPLELRRRALPPLLRHVPDYPEGLARALLAYEAGDPTRALEIARRHHNQSPDDPRYSSMIEALERELKGATQGG